MSNTDCVNAIKDIVCFHHGSAGDKLERIKQAIAYHESKALTHQGVKEAGEA